MDNIKTVILEEIDQSSPEFTQQEDAIMFSWMKEFDLAVEAFRSEYEFETEENLVMIVTNVLLRVAAYKVYESVSKTRQPEILLWRAAAEEQFKMIEEYFRRKKH